MGHDPGAEPAVNIDLQAGAAAVVVRARGRLPAGSRGNPDAHRLRAAVDEALGQARGRAVVLDLSGLAYTWGNGVAGVVLDERVVVLLGRPWADAWNSLLTSCAPRWSEQVGRRLRFVDPPGAGAGPAQDQPSAPHQPSGSPSRS